MYAYSGYSPQNADATVNALINANTGSAVIGAEIHTWGGYTDGVWYGTPSNADALVLHQTYVASAVALDISLSGSGLSVSDGTFSKTGTCSSDPVNNYWYITAPHENVSAWCFAVPTTMAMSLCLLFLESLSPFSDIDKFAAKSYSYE